MKKLLFSTIVLMASVSFAAASLLPGKDLLLSGTVTAINDLTITPTPESITLDIVNGETGRKVADVKETSNNLLGYKIYMRSANASNLVHSIDNSKKTAYTISYDGGSYISLTNADQQVKDSGALPGLTDDTSLVAVNVTPYATAPAGTYSDTVTISIVAN
jgi:hypothetical protein